MGQLLFINQGYFIFSFTYILESVYPYYLCSELRFDIAISDNQVEEYLQDFSLINCKIRNLLFA